MTHQIKRLPTLCGSGLRPTAGRRRVLAHTIGSCAGFLVLIALAFLAGRWTPAGSITHQHVGGSTAPADADELQGATLAGRQQLTTPPKQPQPQRGQRQQQRKRLRAFVGIFSSFTVHGRNSTGYFYKYCYECRRAAIRATWFATLKAQSHTWDSLGGVEVRFVIGHHPNTRLEEALHDESSLHSDIMRLPVQEGYTHLPNKTATFFAAVAEHYDADWVIKMDDDVYLNSGRLLTATKQWERMGAGYIGCFKNGVVWTEPGTRWYEPQHLLVGPTYWLHAYGSIYALAGRVVQSVIVRNSGNLRLLANEDTSVGAWMLSHNVVHFEDLRLCSPICTEASVGIVRNDCAGLCHPVQDMLRLHKQPLCLQPPKSDNMPYHTSESAHIAFEEMWV